MVRSIQSLGLHGVTGYLVSAECDLSGGLPAFTVVGLPDTAVSEARERVRAAIKNYYDKNGIAYEPEQFCDGDCSCCHEHDHQAPEE